MIDVNVIVNNTEMRDFLFRHSFVSKRYKLFYLSTPKVACTSLKWWFASLEGYSKLISEDTESFESDPDLKIHDRFPLVAPEVTGLSPEALIEPITSDEYFRFAVVRNPYTRLFSAWQSKILLREPLQSSPYLKYDFFWTPINSVKDLSLAFEAFLSHLASREAPRYWDDHWTPQTSIICPDLISYTVLAQLENPRNLTLALANHLGPQSMDPFSTYHKNESILPYSSVFLTKPSVELIQTLFKEDFERFGYSTTPPKGEKEISLSQFKRLRNAIQLIRGRHERIVQIRTAASSQLSNLKEVVSNCETKINDLTDSLNRKNSLMDQISNQAIDREAQISGLNRLVNEKEQLIQELIAQVHDRNEQIIKLNQLSSENDQTIQRISSQIIEGDKQISNLTRLIDEANQALDRSFDQISKRNEQIAILTQSVQEKDQLIQQHFSESAVLEQKLGDLDLEVLNYRQTNIDLQTVVITRDEQLRNIKQRVMELGEQYAQLLQSHSWQITRPIRFVARCIKSRGVSPGDREAIIRELKIITRRLPVFVKYRRQLNNIFFKVTGWSKYPVDRPQTSFPETVQASGFLHSDNLNIVNYQNTYSERGIVPFFGPRNPYGKKRVAILTNMLLDWDDGHLRFGGGERYALQLALLLQELGLDVTFFQPSYKGDGEGNYFGFRVKTFLPRDSYGEFQHEACTYFTENTMEYDHVYYHLPEYASGLLRDDGLMTCHGIWFDHNNYPTSFFRTQEWFSHVHRSFSNPQGIVSVDTHSISFIRDMWPDISNRIKYIPNFYDEKSYNLKNSRRNTGKLLILFPRRSQINRGSRLFPQIVKNIPFDVNIEWVGEGDDFDNEIIKKVCISDTRVKFRYADFDEMPDYYNRADIVVIPSIASEGTSLACIEALASGCAVVASNIGGLCDLIHDGVNGLLVDPNWQAIADAINFLIQNDSERERLQKIAPESVRPLELKHWQEKWANVFLEHGWIDLRSYEEWKTRNRIIPISTQKKDRWVILTRNGIHGGVESIIREQSKLLEAPVIVCGGHDIRETCPFEYTRADHPIELKKMIDGYDVILYHWLPDWALDVIRETPKTSLEFVHRKDTCDNDKKIPAGIVTHSKFLANHIFNEYGRICRVIEHPIDTELFAPSSQSGNCIGAITSYYETKGLDIFLRAWALIKENFPNLHVRFYGYGDQQLRLKDLAESLGIVADFFPPTKAPWIALRDYRCVVAPSRVEGFPVAILEALAMNIPVVASDLEGIKEFNSNAIQRGHPAYIHVAQSENIEDYSKVIRSTLETLTISNSRDYISEYFTTKRHLDNLLNARMESRFR